MVFAAKEKQSEMERKYCELCSACFEPKHFNISLLWAETKLCESCRKKQIAADKLLEGKAFNLACCLHCSRLEKVFIRDYYYSGLVVFWICRFCNKGKWKLRKKKKTGLAAFYVELRVLMIFASIAWIAMQNYSTACVLIVV